MGAHPGKTFVLRPARLGRKRSAIAAFVAMVIGLALAQSHGQAQGRRPPPEPPDALPYAGGYLVTGNYVVGGVDLTDQANPADPVTGLSEGIIHMHGVPRDATIVAAYLYWETITVASDLTQANGVTFRGHELNLDDPVAVKKSSQPLIGSTASCWSSGTPLTMTHFKADVLRFLPIRKDAADNPTTKRLVNDQDLQDHGEDPHTVELPTRTGNQAPESAGASLVVVYVDTNPSEPLRKVVFYEGLYIQPSLTDPMNQKLRGFYRSAANKSAKVTSISGNGQPNNNERVFFNDGTNTQVSPPDPLFGGSSSQRGWSQHETTEIPTPGVSRDVTYNVSSLMNPGNNSSGGYGETARFTVDHTQGGSYDCLTWGAVIFSTAVADIDPANDPSNPNAPIGDGIPDGLEDATSALKDPDDVVLPNLNAMGANSGHRDLFVEFNAMWAVAGTSWGSDAAPYDSSKGITTLSDPSGHHHWPTPADFKMMGDRYAAHGITPHFDVGNRTSYHALGKVNHSDWVDDYESTVADGYLVPSSFARGGELIKEVRCDTGTPQPPTQPVATSPACIFPDYPGVVAWPYGVQMYKDFPVKDDGSELTSRQLNNPSDPNFYNWNESMRRRRFDRNRRGLFHYVLLGHLSSKRKSSDPNSHDYKVPTGRSGIAALPGDTALVTLGRFDEFVARPYARSATIFHELGHNYDLWHGMLPATWGNKATGTTTSFEPNCKPFPTSMSYIYQLHGLYDNEDNIQLDYSNVQQADLSEMSTLADAGLSPSTIYRSAWYAPATSALAMDLGVSAAPRYCSGLKFDPAHPPSTAMARVYNQLNTDNIDWNGDNTANSAASNQDVNFDAALSSTLAGFNEWAALRLNQMGASVKVRFFKAAGDEFIPGGGDEFIPGQGNEFLPGEGDEFIPGGGDEFLPGGGDEWIPGTGDEFLPGGGDEFIPGTGDEFLPGGGDEFLPGGGLPELDDEATRGLGRTVPYRVTACVIGENGCTSPPSPDPNFLNHRFHVTWNPPIVDPVASYAVSRKRVDTATATYPWVNRPPTTSSTPAYDNTEQLPNGVDFSFRVRANFVDGGLSAFSKTVSAATHTARNDAPHANDDPDYTVQRNRTLTVSAQAGVLANDTDVDTPASFWRVATPRPVTGPTNGTLVLNADGSFVYTPTNGFRGRDTFTYKANNGNWSEDSTVPLSPDSNIATVTITVR